MNLWELIFTNASGREIVFRFSDEAKAREQAKLYEDAGVNVRVLQVHQTSDHLVPWDVSKRMLGKYSHD